MVPKVLRGPKVQREDVTPATASILIPDGTGRIWCILIKTWLSDPGNLWTSSSTQASHPIKTNVGSLLEENKCANFPTEQPLLVMSIHHLSRFHCPYLWPMHLLISRDLWVWRENSNLIITLITPDRFIWAGTVMANAGLIIFFKLLWS